MASAEELEKYKESENSVSKQQDFINRVKNLKNYTFNDDEYHTALMLLYYFKDTPKEFTLIKLEALLQPRNSVIERKVAETAARDLYIGMQKHFTSEIGKERRETGCNDAIEVASYTQKDSAANILILFRQNFEDQIIGKSPNLTNIRKVRYDDIVKEPTDEYLRFLIEWYNSLESVK